MDFSAPSDAALDYAQRLAAVSGGSVHLLHAIEETPVPMPFAGPFDTDVPSPTALLDRVKERLIQQIRPLNRGALAVTGRVVFGSPAEKIVSHGAEKAFNLIVMGTQRRTGLADVAVGSVAAQVVRAASCPVDRAREADWNGRVRRRDPCNQRSIAKEVYHAPHQSHSGPHRFQRHSRCRDGVRIRCR
jgi:nucleotide-binding universal stress UspA family protein